MIIAFFYCYGTISLVVQLVGRLWSTVKSFLQRACERGHVNNLPRSGRPEVLTRRTKRPILCAVRSNQTMTRNELRNRYAPEVSLSTIDRMLRDHNIRKWIATDRPKLKEEHAKKWLAWAIARKNWTAEDFEGIIYSDECSVEKSCDPRQIWMFRTPQRSG